MLHIFQGESQGVSAETGREVEAWARRALGIDERCSLAWVELSYVEHGRPGAHWRRALDYALKAAVLGPRNEFAVRPLGGGQEPLALRIPGFREASRLQPLYLPPQINVATSLLLLGRPSEALAALEPALRLEPTMPWALYRKALVLNDLGPQRSIT